jgi:hypothetical protein
MCCFKRKFAVFFAIDNFSVEFAVFAFAGRIEHSQFETGAEQAFKRCIDCFFCDESLFVGYC